MGALKKRNLHSKPSFLEHNITTHGQLGKRKRRGKGVGCSPLVCFYVLPL